MNPIRSQPNYFLIMEPFQYTEELMNVNTVITIHYLQGLLMITLSLYLLAPPKTEGTFT